MFKTSRRTFGLGLVVALAATVSCSKLFLENPLEPGVYGSSEKELLRLWTDVLTAAKRDDRQRLVEMMASMKMSPEELAMLPK